MDDLGDRMKAYEARTEQRLSPEFPICVRIDGRAFSSYTRGCKRPYDEVFSRAMRSTAAYLTDETHARIAYTQSDEITLIYHSNEGSETIFGGRVQKLASVLASMAAAKFNQLHAHGKLAAFDARVWQVPTLDEATNVLLWRALDARKNAVSSAAHAHISHKKLQGKNQAQMLEMLARLFVYFDGYPREFRHGTFLKRIVEPKYLPQETWDLIPDSKKPESRTVMRSSVQEMDWEFFGDYTHEDRVTLVFGENA